MFSTGLLDVFVYGTLKPGGFYHQRYCAGQVNWIQPAIARGNLYHLPLGYPAMTPGPGTVQGFVLSLTDISVLYRLDELEGYTTQGTAEENAYDRRCIETFHPNTHFLGPAWTYMMEPEQVTQLGGILLPDGNWDVNYGRDSVSYK